MDRRNNIFEYSPKELTTDAFLNWIFIEITENPQLVQHGGRFFHLLGLCAFKSDSIRGVSVSRQVKNTDLILQYSVNGIAHHALFENKTFSTFSPGQLNKYKKTFPNYKYYKYLKLAYINYSERQYAIDSGYDIIEGKTLYTALQAIQSDNIIINYYSEYLRKCFLDPFEEIEQSLIPSNRYDLFEKGQAQQYFMSLLHKEIADIGEKLEFTSSANTGGTAWTQLGLCFRESAYPNKICEYLFWRIDRRGYGFYIRLNQYANINKNEKEALEAKRNNLQKIKPQIEEMCLNYNLNLGKTTNGVKETDVVILFFKDNNLSDVFNVLPDLSREIYRLYKSVTDWE